MRKPEADTNRDGRRGPDLARRNVNPTEQGPLFHRQATPSEGFRPVQAEVLSTSPNPVGAGSVVFVVRWLTFASFLLVLTSCASTGPDYDPYEAVNRRIHAFNEMVDDAVVRPVATAYQAITPGFVDQGVTNISGNLSDAGSAINSMLQLKLGDAAESAMRVAVNSTMGVGGLVDIASEMGIEKHDEDFGQTLGKWGMGSGAYLVLPLLGPSSVRDALGAGLDVFTDPLFHLSASTQYPARGIRAIDRRADLLSVETILDKAALDEYSYIRDAYLQRRQYRVYDGNPPEED